MGDGTLTEHVGHRPAGFRSVGCSLTGTVVLRCHLRATSRAPLDHVRDARRQGLPRPTVRSSRLGLLTVGCSASCPSDAGAPQSRPHRQAGRGGLRGGCPCDDSVEQVTLKLSLPSRCSLVTPGLQPHAHGLPCVTLCPSEPLPGASGQGRMGPSPLTLQGAFPHAQKRGILSTLVNDCTDKGLSSQRE